MEQEAPKICMSWATSLEGKEREIMRAPKGSTRPHTCTEKLLENNDGVILSGCLEVLLLEPRGLLTSDDFF